MFLGIEDHIWIISLLVGAMVSVTVNQMRPKNNIPLAEIYLKKGGSIVWFMDANDVLWPHSLKNTQNGYFAVYTTKFKGIYHINTKYSFRMAGSSIPNYLIASKEMNNYHPKMAGLANQFLDRNRIYEFKQKHMKQATNLRGWLKKFGNIPESLQAMKAKSIGEKDEIDNGIEVAEQAYEKNLASYNSENRTDYLPDERQKMLTIVDYMLKVNLIDDKMAETFIYRIENGILDLNELRSELKDVPNIEIAENLDIGVERFFREFGSETPMELMGIIDNARTHPKELKKMTPVPVKQFVPGSVILAGGITVIMLLVLVSNGTIGGDLLGSIPGLPGLP